MFIYQIEKVLKNKKILVYLAILLLLLVNIKEFYKSSKQNIRDNFESLFIKKNNLNNINLDFEKFTPFKNMNYDPLIHKFYLNFQMNCKKIKKEHDIKYSINRTNNWDFDHYCETKPLYYFIWGGNLGRWTKIFNEASFIDKNLDATNYNTIEFFSSNEKNLDNYKVLYIYDVYDELDVKKINYYKIDEQQLRHRVNYLDLTQRYILIAKKLDKK